MKIMIGIFVIITLWATPIHYIGVTGWKLDNRYIKQTNQDIMYMCPLYTMCHCASLPNETATLLEINCNEVALYKFPEFLHSTVKHIEISRTYLQNVDDETFQGLRLESLKMTDNRLTEFTEKSFSSMTHSLITLDITGNHFQFLPLRTLRNVHSLSRLVVQRNYIQDLDGNWGNLAESLRSLHLSGNSIIELTPLIHGNSNGAYNGDLDEKDSTPSSSPLMSHFSGSSLSSSSSSAVSLPTSSITSSSSSTSTFTTSQVKTFAKLRKLVWLDLSANRIAHISSSALPRQIVTIDLSKNIIQNFPINVCEHLRDLKILSLKDNLINRLDDISLQSNRLYLEKLDLGLNIIEQLPIIGQLFNTTLMVKAISFDRNYLTHIPAAVFQQLGIVHMVLAFNLIETIDDRAFVGLETTLEYLDMERNKLQEIPTGVPSLQKLRYLYFTSNQISEVKRLPETLRVLSLSGNNFTLIPSTGLTNCTELSYLNMGYNKISEIQENDFSGWGGQLQTLLLRNNKITRLNFGAFNGLDSIKEISLSFNDIHYVHPNVFENISKTLKILELSFGIYREDFPLEALSYLTELMWLGLDNNNLKIIPDNSLATLSQLTYINLAFNRITHLPRDIFIADIHRHLLEVDLSYNLIDRLVSNTFDALPELQMVQLGSNRIRSMEKHSFYDLPYLTYVDLTYNQIKNISEAAFAFLPRLLGVDLMYNQLSTLSFRMFKHVSNATAPMRVNISNNQLTSLDGEISSYLHIYSLDASNNFLSDPAAFKNLGYSLRVLYLNGNNFTLLGNHAFGDLDAVEILNLSSNNITSIRRRSFQGLGNLQELDLSRNKIEQLQVEQFSNLKKLRVLYLTSNNLKTLPRDVFLNTRLEFLDISNNQLSLWPVTAFSDVGFTLRSIMFSDNNLEYLDSNMFINTQFLLELNLAGNKLTVLPDNTFSSLNNLTKIDLGFNPLVTTNFYELLLNIPRLRSLNLRATGIYSLPQLALRHLTELDVSQNYIQDLQPLSTLRVLRVLKISQNRIMNLTNFAKFMTPSLRVLDLSKNPIRKLTQHDFGNQLHRLEELHLENVKVTSTDAFIRLHALRILKISSQNHLSDVVARLRGLQQLYVHVNENSIDDRLFATLTNSTKLNFVEITGSRVTAISNNAFYGLKNNHDLTIRITGTAIDDLPIGIFYALKYIPRLRINLENNSIIALAPDSFYPNATSWDAVGTRSVLGGLDLSGNPLQCDCGLVWLGHWLRRWLRETAQTNLISKDELRLMLKRARENTCIDPQTGRQLTFLEIFPEDLLCHASALSGRAAATMLSVDTGLKYYHLCVGVFLFLLSSELTDFWRVLQ